MSSLVAFSAGRKLAVGCLAIGLGAGVLAVAGPAQAEVRTAPAASSRTFVVPAGRTVSIGGARVTAAPNTTTSCTLTAYQPFRYGTNPSGGGEEGFAGISCNQPVVSLYAEVELFHNGTQVASNSGTNSGASSILVDTEYPVLASGSYRSAADGSWSASDNSGFLPLQYSSTAYYSCC